MTQGGHNKKPTAVLKLTGQYRKDRHGHREDEQIVGAKPRKPASLKGEAAKEWARVVGASPAGVYGEQDVSLLIQWCQCAELWRELSASGQWDEALKITDRMCKLAAKLGIGPTERTRLRIDKSKTPKDDFEKWEAQSG